MLRRNRFFIWRKFKKKKKKKTLKAVVEKKRWSETEVRIRLQL